MSEPSIDAIDFTTGAGDYEVIDEIARGGMGKVLRVRDRNLRREMAVKVLLEPHAGRTRIERRFVEEAQIGGQLQHPGIVPVYDLGRTDDGRPYFAMKLVKGRTLAELLESDQEPSARQRAEWVAIFERVCQTLAYAHARGVIHRDLKPANVMVGAFGEVQIVDWGLAKVLTREASGDETEHTDARRSVIRTVRTEADSGSEGDSPVPIDGSIAGSVLGSPAYMPPEQAQGRLADVDERADVFALGAMLLEILTGVAPYEESELGPIEAAASADHTAALERLRSCAADPSLITLVERCLAPAREARPRNAGEVAEAVSEFVTTTEARAVEARVEAAKATAIASAQRQARRLTTALAAAVILVIAIGGGGWIWVRSDAEARRQRLTDRVQQTVRDAAALLGEARASRLGEPQIWGRLIEADERFREFTPLDALDDASRSQVTELQFAIDRAIRDRRMLERLEELLIRGASNFDPVSWRAMETAYEEAFRAYGIDVFALPREEAIRRLRESDLTVELADALELWMSTHAVLAEKPESPQAAEALLDPWLSIIYAIDDDPFRTRRRKLYRDPNRDPETLRDFVRGADFSSLSARSLSWLATLAGSTGDVESTLSIFRRAIVLHPDDAMLHFDYGFNLLITGAWEKAAREFQSAIAIRPHTSGLWRLLGVALLQAGEFEESRGALARAVEIDPQHAPIRIDLGVTLEAMGRTDEAIAQYRVAIEQSADPLALGRLALALGRSGSETESRALLQKCYSAGMLSGAWRMPYSEWREQCRTHVDNLVWWQRFAGSASNE